MMVTINKRGMLENMISLSSLASGEGDDGVSALDDDIENLV